MEERDARLMNEAITKYLASCISLPVKFEFDPGHTYIRTNPRPMTLDPEIARALTGYDEATHGEKIVSNTRTGVKCWVCGAKLEIPSFTFMDLYTRTAKSTDCACGLFSTTWFPISEAYDASLKFRVGYVKGERMLGAGLPDWWCDAVAEATRLHEDTRPGAKQGKLLMAPLADAREGHELMMFADWLEENEYPLNAEAIRKEITNARVAHPAEV